MSVEKKMTNMRYAAAAAADNLYHLNGLKSTMSGKYRAAVCRNRAKFFIASANIAGKAGGEKIHFLIF